MTDEHMSLIATQQDRALTALAPTPDAVAHAVVLAIEGLVTDAQFMALTGQHVSEIEALLAEPEMLSRVQKLSLELQNKGALARLEALKHSRDAVLVAAKIMNDDELHPSPRLAAADYVAKVAGTMKAPALDGASRERVKITINIPSADGSEPQRVVIDAEPAIETGDT
jgi:hypothetical protein